MKKVALIAGFILAFPSIALAQISSGNLQTKNALSELSGNASTARTNLGLGSASTQPASAFDAAGAAAAATASALQKSSNLSDLGNATTARTNLGLGTAATQNSSAFDTSGSAAAVQASSVQKSNNGSDFASPSATLTNLGGIPTSAIGVTISPLPVPYTGLPIGTSANTVASGNDSRITGAMQSSAWLANPGSTNLVDLPNQPVVTANNICEIGDSIISYGGFGPNRNDPAETSANSGFQQNGIQTQIGRLTGIFPSLAGNQGYAGDTTQAAGSDPGIRNRLTALLAAQTAPCYHAPFFIDEGGVNDVSSAVSGVNPQLTPAVTIANREFDISLEIANGSTVFALPIMSRNLWGTVASPFTLAQWLQAEKWRLQINKALKSYCALYTKCRWIPLDAVLGGSNVANGITVTAVAGSVLTINTTAGAGNAYRGWTVYIPPASGTGFGTTNIVTASNASTITLASSTPAPAVSSTISLAQNGVATASLENQADGLHPDGAGAEAIATQIVTLNPGFFPAETPGSLGTLDSYDATNNPFGSVLVNGQMLGTNGTVISGASGTVPAAWTAQANSVTSTGTQVFAAACPATGLSTGSCEYTQTVNRTAAGGSSEQFDPTNTVTNNLPIGTEFYGKCMVNVTSGSTAVTGDLYNVALEVTYDTGPTLNASDGSTNFTYNLQRVNALGNWRYYQTPIFTTTTTATMHLVLQVSLNSTTASSGTPVAQVTSIANCGIYPVPAGSIS